MVARRALLLLLLALGTSASWAQPEAPFAFEVVSPIAALPFRVIDAEFSTQLNAIVAVSESPNRIHVYVADTQALTTIALGFVPRCVSVSPDGTHAAVGHDHKITYVDLVGGTVVKTLDVSTDVLDVVLAANGFVYAFPRYDQWENIRCVRIDTNVETIGSGLIYAGTIGRLHPSGNFIYGADNGLSPADIEKHEITNGTSVYKYDSPYHGDYAMCGNLWISPDGTRIYTACGNVFRSTTSQSTDMRYIGMLSDGPTMRWLSHTDTGSNIAVLPSQTGPWWNPTPLDHEIHYYTTDFLLYRGKATLPSFVVENQSWQSHGRWIFFNAAGTKQYVIVQASAESGILYDFGVVTIDCTDAAVQLTPSSVNVSAFFANIAIDVTGTSGCGWKAAANNSWLNSLSSGVGDGTVALTVAANNTLAPRTGTVTIGNATFTVNQAGIIPLNLNAIATSATSIDLTWVSPAVDHFEVWRSSGGTFALVGSPATTSFTDSTVAADTGYIYKVKAVVSGGGASDFGVPDYAHTFALTDPLPLAGVPIRAAHVTELRTVVNTLRAAAGLGAATFTDGVLGGVIAKRIHVTELRDAIDGLRTSLGLPAFAFPALPVNGVILAQTTQELRLASQ